MKKESLFRGNDKPLTDLLDIQCAQLLARPNCSWISKLPIPEPWASAGDWWVHWIYPWIRMPHSRIHKDENESGIVCSDFWLCLGPPAQLSSRRFKFLGALLKPRFFICKVQSLWMSSEHEIQAPGTRLNLTQAIWILCHSFCKAKSAKTKGCRSKSCSLQATNAPQNNDLTFEGKRLMTTSSCSHPCFPPWLGKKSMERFLQLSLLHLYISNSQKLVCFRKSLWQTENLKSVTIEQTLETFVCTGILKQHTACMHPHLFPYFPVSM